MDICYPHVEKPKACVYVLLIRKPYDAKDTGETLVQEKLLTSIYIFKDFEAALFALDQMTSCRGHTVPVGWKFIIRRVETDTFNDPQDVILVSWTRLPDKDQQCPGTSNGKLTLHPTLNSIS
jgi:hypothetical protein